MNDETLEAMCAATTEYLHRSIGQKFRKVRRDCLARSDFIWRCLNRRWLSRAYRYALLEYGSSVIAGDALRRFNDEAAAQADVEVMWSDSELWQGAAKLNAMPDPPVEPYLRGSDLWAASLMSSPHCIERQEHKNRRLTGVLGSFGAPRQPHA